MRNNKIFRLNFAKKIGLFLSFLIAGCINPISKTALAESAQSSQLTESAKQEAATVNKGSIVPAKEGAAIKVQHELDNIATKEATLPENALKSQKNKKSTDKNKDIKKDINKNQNLLLNDEKSVDSAANALQAAGTKQGGSRDYSSQIVSDSALIKPVKHWRLDLGLQTTMGNNEEMYIIYEQVNTKKLSSCSKRHQRNIPSVALEYRGGKIYFLPKIATVFALKLLYHWGYADQLNSAEKRPDGKVHTQKIYYKTQRSAVLATVSNYLTAYSNFQPYIKFSLGLALDRRNVDGIFAYAQEDENKQSKEYTFLGEGFCLAPHASVALGIQSNSSRDIKPYIELFAFNQEPFFLNANLKEKQPDPTLSEVPNAKIKTEFVRAFNYGLSLGVTMDF